MTASTPIPPGRSRRAPRWVDPTDAAGHLFRPVRRPPEGDMDCVLLETDDGRTYNLLDGLVAESHRPQRRIRFRRPVACRVCGASCVPPGPSFSVRNSMATSTARSLRPVSRRRQGTDGCCDGLFARRPRASAGEQPAGSAGMPVVAFPPAPWARCFAARDQPAIPRLRELRQLPGRTNMASSAPRRRSLIPRAPHGG